MYAEQRRSSDNMSARSSDSDMSDVSVPSHASSISHLSSISYTSIQSELPGGRFRSVLFVYLSDMMSVDPSNTIILTQPPPLSKCLLHSLFKCMLIIACFSVLFLHANRCMCLSCMLCRTQTHTHNNTWTQTWTQIQVIRGGQEGQEDLMGGERRGGQEEGVRKETFLKGVQTQETHCIRRHKGVQVKSNRS